MDMGWSPLFRPDNILCRGANPEANGTRLLATKKLNRATRVDYVGGKKLRLIANLAEVVPSWGASLISFAARSMPSSMPTVRLRNLAGSFGTPRPPSGPKRLLVRGKTEVVGQLRIIYAARQNHAADT